MRKTRISKEALHEKAMRMIKKDPVKREKITPKVVKTVQEEILSPLPPSIILRTAEYICEHEMEISKGRFVCEKTGGKTADGKPKQYPRDCTLWKTTECNVVLSLRWWLAQGKKDAKG